MIGGRDWLEIVMRLTPFVLCLGLAASTLPVAVVGQRRKMLRSSLKAVPGALDTLEILGIDSERRAETVSVEEFVALARALS